MAIGVRLLTVGALFQLFDGVQAVATGALRGLGDTRTAMIWNLAGHWFVGLPLGFAQPLVLLGLLSLPVLWWLLRLVPPRPRVQKLGSEKLLLALHTRMAAGLSGTGVNLRHADFHGSAA